MKKYTKQFFVESGRKGGQATLKNQGKKYFSKIRKNVGKKGAKTTRAKFRLKRPVVKEKALNDKSIVPAL